jgi:hypothetical protein
LYPPFPSPWFTRAKPLTKYDNSTGEAKQNLLFSRGVVFTIMSMSKDFVPHVDLAKKGPKHSLFEKLCHYQVGKFVAFVNTESFATGKPRNDSFRIRMLLDQLQEPMQLEGERKSRSIAFLFDDHFKRSCECGGIAHKK